MVKTNREKAWAHRTPRELAAAVNVWLDWHQRRLDDFEGTPARLLWRFRAKTGAETEDRYIDLSGLPLQDVRATSAPWVQELHELADSLEQMDVEGWDMELGGGEGTGAVQNLEEVRKRTIALLQKIGHSFQSLEVVLRQQAMQKAWVLEKEHKQTASEAAA